MWSSNLQTVRLYAWRSDCAHHCLGCGDHADVDHNMQQGIDIRGIDSADECDEEDRGEPAEMDYYASEAEDFDD